MSPVEFAWRVLLEFLFHSEREEVAIVASMAISLWVVIAGAYASFFERDPYPKFFGVPPRQAVWDHKPFPRKLIALPIIIGGIMLLIAWPAKAAEPAQKYDPLAVVDESLDLIISKIQYYQAQYAAQKGGYFQALWTHSTPPADGSLAAPDLLNSRPTDQLETWGTLWQELNISGNRLPMRARIDVYDGPSGKGYVVIVEALIEGTVQTRAVNIGPEAYRDLPWQKADGP